MEKRSFQGKGDPLYNRNFISYFLNPALKKLDNVQLYQERGPYWSNRIDVTLKSEKTNMIIKRADLKSLIEELAGKANKIAEINGAFYDLEEKIEGDGSWVIASNYKPVFRAKLNSFGRSQCFDVESFNRDTSLSSYLDCADLDCGNPWNVSLKFKGSNEVIGEIYRNLLHFYKIDKKAKILV